MAIMKSSGHCRVPQCARCHVPYSEVQIYSVEGCVRRVFNSVNCVASFFKLFLSTKLSVELPQQVVLNPPPMHSFFHSWIGRYLRATCTSNMLLNQTFAQGKRLNFPPKVHKQSSTNRLDWSQKSPNRHAEKSGIDQMSNKNHF